MTQPICSLCRHPQQAHDGKKPPGHCTWLRCPCPGEPKGVAVEPVVEPAVPAPRTGWNPDPTIEVPPPPPPPVDDLRTGWNPLPFPPVAPWAVAAPVVVPVVAPVAPVFVPVPSPAAVDDPDVTVDGDEPDAA